MAYTENEPKEFTEKVVKIDRVAKVVKGGRRFSFNALTIVGDSKSKVGIGFGKANEVPDAIRKSIEAARKNMIDINILGHTIPHEVVGKFKSAKVYLRPCTPGTGLIAGDAVRSVVEKAGVQDILSKSYGSDNSLNIVKATFEALKKLETPLMAAKRRGISLKRLFGQDFIEEAATSSLGE
ncbi:MAG: 30S ribosomal protein S5 [Leptospiraceae bacterium]|nr:30S ribosomal protein S5 [Leptospiraceae bacterium]MCP5496656.1 30S ribosomal protein S5 [Leptospiraceae bacterium]